MVLSKKIALVFLIFSAKSYCALPALEDQNLNTTEKTNTDQTFLRTAIYTRQATGYMTGYILGNFCYNRTRDTVQGLLELNPRKAAAHAAAGVAGLWFLIPYGPNVEQNLQIFQCSTVIAATLQIASRVKDDFL